MSHGLWNDISPDKADLNGLEDEEAHCVVPPIRIGGHVPVSSLRF